MTLFEFEIFTDKGTQRYAQWALDADHAFEVLNTINPACLEGFRPECFDVLFQPLSQFDGPALVYWLEAGEA